MTPAQMSNYLVWLYNAPDDQSPDEDSPCLVVQCTRWPRCRWVITLSGYTMHQMTPAQMGIYLVWLYNHLVWLYNAPDDLSPDRDSPCQVVQCTRWPQLKWGLTLSGCTRWPQLRLVITLSGCTMHQMTRAQMSTPERMVTTGFKSILIHLFLPIAIFLHLVVYTKVSGLYSVFWAPNVILTSCG